MKKPLIIILTAVLALCGTRASAQWSAGFGLDRYTQRHYSDSGNSRSSLNGIYFGAEYNFELSFGFGVAPGVYYSSCFKNKTKHGERHKRSEQTLNIPVNLTYGIDIDPDIRFIAYTGPVLGIGTVSRTIVGNIYTNRFSDENISHIKLQWNFGFGAELLEHYRVSAGFCRGLNNRNNSKSIPGTIKSHDFHMGVAYIF